MTFPFPVRRCAGAAALVLASTLALAACTGDGQKPVSDETTEQPSETSTAEPTPTDDASPTEEPTSTPTQADGTAVPVYYAGDGPRRAALFREFHRVEGDPLLEAARLVAGNGTPDDPDYRTLWPQMEVASVQATDGVLLVDLPTDAFTERPDGMSRRAATLAIQQLVYSLQGAQQERIPVVIERSETEPSLFGISTETEFTAAGALKTLNLVNITSPAEGATVTGDTLTVTGVANSFEASGPCRLLQAGTEVAMEGYQSAGWTEDKLFPFEVDLPLAGVTGEVVVQCETDDPTGGTEGNGPSIDTKTITVK
ncbi:Sporulation and spore germination [Nocardioides exalbidus]|uniref:Sporulation and spore germination n=1 Tax=Nocardioides exalbidus TaxID=402596 RepID=A0A1H4VSW8_9ACTN|nr:Gmad2 immunoglobulin-like domain-containing protein [Nocardioides exalbidus]SEC84065.1 Sporulation and spore germination [Nocardioides exalbidus]